MTNPFCLPKKLTHQNTNIMLFSTSKSQRFQAPPPNPPTPPSAPAPLAAPRPQRGRGGARSQPHPGSQRLHHPCPGGRLAQHPVPRDGSSTTSPGPEWTAPHHLNPDMLPMHKNLDSQWVAGKRRWIRSAWKRRGGLLIHRLWGFGVGRQLEVQWGGYPHPPHLL